MHIKKQVIENIKSFLENKQRNIRMKLRSNIYELRRIEKEQTILKREIAKYGELLRVWNDINE